MARTHPLDPPGKQAGTPPVKERRSGRRVIGISALLLVGLGALGYYLGQSRAASLLPPAIPLAPGVASGFNLVLFTLDTLRADRVGCYGYQAIETPTLDALAAGGLRFADAVTAVPTTLASHGTIMTGNYPPVHGLRDNGSYRLVDKHETLAERLQGEGYATAAFIGAFVLDKRYGLDQGFDLYDDDISEKYLIPGANPTYPERPGNVVTDSAITWLEEHHAAQPSRPFFVWIHLFDPHTPYAPPEPFKTRYASNAYDGEVAFTDQQVGRFLEKLRQLDLFDRTLIVAVGDHGEGLGDHGERTHGLLIYESTMRVPLILHAPAAIPQARLVDDRLVATVDVAPTILDLLGFDPGDCDGISLLAASPADRAVYVETLHPKLSHGWSPLYGLRRHTDKYIAAPTPEYYDLRGDPSEDANLWPKRPAEAVALANRLKDVRRSFPTEEQTSDAAITPSAEALKKLAALGYVAGAAVPAGPPLDPKEMVRNWERQLETVSRLVGQGRFTEVVPLLEETLASTPNDPELWLLLAHAQAKLGRYDDAIASRLQAMELLPTRSGDHWVQLARLQYNTGDLDAARTSLAEAEHLEPDHGEIYLIRAEMALDAGQYEPALEHCREARRRDPARFTARSWLLQGAAYETTGLLAEAERAYERARESDPSGKLALLNLAEVALGQGQYTRTIELAESIPRQHRGWGESRALMARAYLKLGQSDDAVRVMQELVDAKPADASAHNNLGNVFQELGRLDEAATSYEAALELDPNLWTANYNLALILEAQGQAEAAIGRLRKAVALEPDATGAQCQLARLLGAHGESDEALEVFEQLLQAAPPYAPAYPQAATLFTRLAQPARAIEILRRGNGLLPEDPAIANHLAWLLATSADAELRDGPQAVELAELANQLTGGQYSSVLDTLAAAYAEVGRFDEAVAAASRALDAARRDNDGDMVSAVEARLDLYRKRQAYREP